MNLNSLWSNQFVQYESSVVRRKVFIIGTCTIDLRFVMLQTCDSNCWCPESITNESNRRYCKHVLQTACNVVRLFLFWAKPLILLLWGQLVSMRCPHNRFASFGMLVIECISVANVPENLLWSLNKNKFSISRHWIGIGKTRSAHKNTRHGQDRQDHRNTSRAPLTTSRALTGIMQLTGWGRALP